MRTGRCGNSWRRRSAPCRVRARRAVASLLEKGREIRLVDAALSGFVARVGGARAGCRGRCQRDPRRDAAITMLTATIVRGGQDAAVQQVLAAVSDDCAACRRARSALMRGAEVALLGARAPGKPSGRRGGPPPANLPCPTCPGGRAGPGGAYAFPGTQAIGPAAAAERPDVRALRLNSEPPALVVALPPEAKS